MVALSFTLVSLHLFHLNAGTRYSNAQRARNLAESALNRATWMVIQNPDLGTASSSLDPNVRVQHQGGPSGSYGLVCFDPAQATAQGVGHSLNNLENDASAAGWDQRVVPGQAVHLVGRGHCGGVDVHLEAIIHVPRYPYALSSSGPIASPGGLLVGSVANAGDAAGGVDQIPPDKLLPGHLATNGLDAGGTAALALQGPDILITGDARAVGSVDRDANVEIRGAVRPFDDPVPLPDIDVASYDPTGRPGLQNLTAAPALLQGRARWQGTAQVNGDLVLQDALLYVDGDLTVTGGIRGKGAVVVTGTTSILSGSALDSSNAVALVSGDTLTVNGNQRGSSYFQGILYTEGDLIANDITLMGAVIGNSSGPQGSRLSLRNADIIQVPELTAISFTPSIPGATGTSGLATGGPGGPGGTTGGFTPTGNYFIDSTGTRKDWFVDIDPRLPNQLNPGEDAAAQSNPDLLVIYTLNGSPMEWTTLRDAYNDPNNRSFGPGPTLGATRTRARSHVISSLPSAVTQPNPTPTPGSGVLTTNNGPGSAAGGPGGLVEVDLNKLIQLADKIRPLVWREL